MTTVADKLARKSTSRATTKQVRLKLVYIDFWSAVKLSFLIMLALGIVLVVGTFLIWVVLANTGLFDKVSTLFADISGQENFNLTEIVGLGQVLGFSLVVALLNTVIGTVLGAIATLLYNLSVKITGGVLVGFTNQ